MFIAAAENKFTQTVMRVKRQGDSHKQIILVHSTLNYIHSSEQPMSISLYNQSQITTTHHKEVTLNPTKPTHPFCNTSHLKLQSHCTGFYKHVFDIIIQLQETK